MSITTAEVSALRQALATGAKTVQVGSTSITYRSLEEMHQALAFAEASAGVAPAGQVERVFHPVTRSGL